MRRIAVLLTCYNRVETTLKCLARLTAIASRMPEAKLDVWLVDDASPDQTGEKVKAAFPEVHVIQSPGDLYWCRGMRLAWDTAAASGTDYDFYLWLNDDVMLKETAIETLFAEYEAKKGLVVGRFSTDESERDTSFGLVGPTGDWMHGNLVLVSRTVYEKIGPICGDYTHAYGDHDYGLHAKKAGFALTLTKAFCGVCPQQPERYHQFAGKSLKERFALLSDPKGCNIHDAVLFRRRNWGRVMAIVCRIHLFFKALFGKD